MWKRIQCVLAGGLMLAASTFGACGKTVRVADDNDWRNDVIDWLDKLQGGLDDVNAFLDDVEDE